MSVTIQLRGDTSANWATANPTLAQREMALETDTMLIKVGDGVTAWNNLSYWHNGEVNPADFTVVQSEIINARGNRSSVDKRIEAISRYGSPCVGTPQSGDWFDVSRVSTSLTTTAGTANAIRLVPFITSRPTTISAIGVYVTTAAASGLMRMGIYGSDENGWPDQLLWSAPTELSSASIGLKSHTLDFTYDGDRVYWIGLHYSAAITTSGAQTYALPNLGLLTGTGTTYASYIQRSVTYASGFPEVWGYNTAERQTGTPIAPRFRVA